MAASLRERMLQAADDIKAWREDDSRGAGDCIEEICEAEALLREAYNAPVPCGCFDLGDGTGTECAMHEAQRLELERLREKVGLL